jgi:hypothetical protein
MKFTVTKQQVIKALRTEPLMNEAFIHYSQYSHGGGKDAKRFKNNTNCAVCAVGSILDCSLGKKLSLERLGEIGESITKVACPSDREDLDVENESTFSFTDISDLNGLKKVASLAAEKGFLMSGLSMLFEGVMDLDRTGIGQYKNLDGTANRKAREILVNFVKKSFPSKLVIDTKKEY